VITYQQQVHSIEQETFDKLIAIRDLKVQQLENWLTERTGDLKTTATDNELTDLEKMIHKEHRDQTDLKIYKNILRILNRYLKNYDAYDEIFIINPETGIVEISTSSNSEGMDQSDNSYFTQPMKTRELFIKDIYYSKSLARNTMTFSMPIFCTKHVPHHIVGILVARVDLKNSLYALLQDRVGLGKTGETLIVNKEVLTLNELRWHQNAPLNLQIKTVPAVKASQGLTGIAESTDYCGEGVLAAYTYIPQTGWGFVAKQDLAELCAPIKSMMVNFLILIIGAMITILVIGFLIARTIAAPAIEMAATAGKMKKGDFSVKNRINGADELATLAETFNTMAESIESQEELREINDKITQTLVDAKDLPEFRINILKKLVAVTGSQMGAYFVLNRDTKIFEPFTSIGVTPGLLKPFDASTLEGELGMVVETKKTTRIEDIPEDSMFKFRTFTGTILPKEIICIPVIIDDVVSGIVSLSSIKPYPRKVLDIMEQPWTTGFGTALSNMWSNTETARLAAELIEKKYLVDSSSSAIGTCTLDGIMTYVNPSFLETWGFEDDSEVIGKPFPEFWMASEIFDEVMDDLKNKGTWSAEIKAKRNDGTLFDVQASASTVYDKNGKPIEMMSSSIDISERKKAEKKILEINQELQAQAENLQSQTEELQQQSEELQEQNVELEAQRQQVEEANRLKSEFLSNMSHELRTPLNSVMALSRVLMMQAKEKLSDEEWNYLEIIERNGKNLLSLINDILDLSKIEAGKMDISPRPFSIASTIDTIMERLEPVAEEKGIRLHLETPDDLPQIESDEARVHQMLQNLVGNAVKFTEQGEVTVSARYDADNIYIDIADTGIGIAEKDLPYIFAEFRQVDGTTARQYEGAGLGLAISYKGAKMLSGDLSVESTLGKGSTFSLTLPIKWQGMAPVSESVAFRPPAAVEPARKTILVVDDKPHALTMISNYLSQEGYNVITATSGNEALRLAREHRPFAITLDIIMPDMDGWEVLQELKKRPETADIPVIIVSVSDDRQTGIALGAVGYITKPVNRELLIAEINKVDGPTAHSILIVDDNELDRQEMARMIDEEGMQAIVAEDGSECMDMLQETFPDVLVLDLMMPKVDGFEVLERVRSDPETRNLPVIVVTAKDLTQKDKEKLSGNVSSVLKKSDTTSKALLEELRKLLSDIEAEPGLKASGSPKRILLVEDNEASVIQVRTVLEGAGYVMDVVRDGREALDYVGHTIPDGIILDLMMPKVDGFEVLENIRSKEATAGVSVLILTAKDLTPEDLDKLSANNIQQLIYKGDVDREGLLRKTGQMLGMGFETGKPRPETRRINIEHRTSNIEHRMEEKKAEHGVNPQPATILVVEDNPDNMTTIKAILQNRYTILEATDGEEGLRMVLEEKPDLVLLDMSLPKRDGFEVVNELKQNKKVNHIPVIAMTAHAMKGDREKSIEAGCDDYISKPVDPEKLLGDIEKYVRK